MNQTTLTGKELTEEAIKKKEHRERVVYCRLVVAVAAIVFSILVVRAGGERQEYIEQRRNHLGLLGQQGMYSDEELGRQYDRIKERR